MSPHPFVSGHRSVAARMAPAIVVGADAPSSSGEMSLTARLVALGLTVGFLYYLGHKNGRIEGYVQGANEGERLALESIRAHQAVHATANRVPLEDDEEA